MLFAVYSLWSMSLVWFFGANTGIAFTCHTEKIKTKRRQGEDCISWLQERKENPIPVPGVEISMGFF
jgi:hypothetical protein